MHEPEETFIMIVTGDPGTGNSTAIKSMCDRVNGIYSKTNAVKHTNLCTGTTCTDAFVIGGVTCH